MSATTITPLEALRRLIAAVKLIDFADCKDERVWNQLGGELGVADGVVRDFKAEPVTYLRFRAAQQWSGVGGHDIENAEWLETCHAHEIGDDKLPAFPVYAAPVAAKPSEAAQTDWQAFQEWAKVHLGQGYSLDSEEGVFHDKVTRWCFKGFKAGRSLSAPTAAVSAAPSGEVEKNACPVWISVDDRMPDDNQKVIVLYWPFDNHENAQVAGEAEHIQGVFYTDEGDDHHYPSHWSPMPILSSAAITATKE